MHSVHDSSTKTTTTPDASPASTEEADAVASKPPMPRRPRGFAAMDRSSVSAIASKGGKAAHAAGTAHQFSSAEATDAGRKGGRAPHVRRGRGPRALNGASSAPSDARGVAGVDARADDGGKNG